MIAVGRAGPLGPSGELRLLLSGGERSSRRSGMAWGVSLITHLLLVASAALVALFWPEPLPETATHVGVVFYNPPPPPPLPPPRGSLQLPEARSREIAVPAPTAGPTPEPALTVTLALPEEAELVPEIGTPEELLSGVPNGHDLGVPGGMEGGDPNGAEGGVPGGVPGGCEGCTGDGAVPTGYDRAPIPIRMAPPRYPQEAFAKKIEGEVMVELVIDALGRVAHAHVVRSIPQLDEAALSCVREWRFRPAVRSGRPVAARAKAPVTFRIY
jgi:periplasmic protein TonB